jgi:DNA-binding transcriptional LysR family regulator
VVRLNSTIGAHEFERARVTPDGMSLDWESVRLFLEVARGKSFRTAASRLNMTGHGIARRVEQLEQQIGATLFTRHRDGVRLTLAGHQLVSCAEQMEEASRGFVRRRGMLAQPMRGEIKIACTEGLGTFWVTPRLLEFARAHPQILVDLHCSMVRPDELVTRAEADLAIQLEQPAPRDLKIRKIGRMHIMPCASQSYISTYGLPKAKQEIGELHRIVLMYADQGKGHEYYEQQYPNRQQVGFVAMRTNVSTALYAAIVNGLAVGWLPTYYFAIGTPVIPLDIDWVYSFDIWLSYHPDLGEVPRVRRMIDWAVGEFDPQKYPWFRDDFIHPDRFNKQFRGDPPGEIDAAFGRP